MLFEIMRHQNLEASLYAIHLLHRRFPFRFKIEGYSPEEMTKIMLKKVDDMQWKLTKNIINTDIQIENTIKVESKVDDNKIVNKIKNNKDIQDKIYLTEEDLINFFKENKDYFPNFGGDIENFLVQCKFCHSRRVVGLSPKVRCVFTKEDLTNGFDRFKINRSKEADKQKGFKDAFNMMIV